MACSGCACVAATLNGSDQNALPLHPFFRRLKQQQQPQPSHSHHRHHHHQRHLDQEDVEDNNKDNNHASSNHTGKGSTDKLLVSQGSLCTETELSSADIAQAGNAGEAERRGPSSAAGGCRGEEEKPGAGSEALGSGGAEGCPEGMEEYGERDEEEEADDIGGSSRGEEVAAGKQVEGSEMQKARDGRKVAALLVPVDPYEPLEEILLRSEKNWQQRQDLTAAIGAAGAAAGGGFSEAHLFSTAVPHGGTIFWAASAADQINERAASLAGVHDIRGDAVVLMAAAAGALKSSSGDREVHGTRQRRERMEGVEEEEQQAKNLELDRVAMEKLKSLLSGRQGGGREEGSKGRHASGRSSRAAERSNSGPSSRSDCCAMSGSGGDGGGIHSHNEGEDGRERHVDHEGSGMSDMPQEVLDNIFRRLSFESLCACAAVSRQWRECVTEDEPLLLQLLIQPPEPLCSSNKGATPATSASTTSSTSEEQAATGAAGLPRNLRGLPLPLAYLPHRRPPRQQQQRQRRKRKVWAKIPLVVVRAAEVGNMNAMVMMAEQMESKGERMRALDWYKKAARMGHQGSQLRMGEVYYRGEGDWPRDEEEALSWFLRVVKNPNSDDGYLRAAALLLGYMYLDGEGTQRVDYGEAVKWFKVARDLGSIEAEQTVGWLWNTGQY